ncbi:MAG: glycosyltransferase, partial [Gammaproteobacteria bacterium]
MSRSVTTGGDQAAATEAAGAGRGRLVAQRGLFTGPSPVCPDDLYARVLCGAATRARTRLVVHPHSSVTTGSYFGRFPASYWQRWTVVDRVDVELVAYGSGRVSLVASDTEGETRVVAARLITNAAGESVRLGTALDKFLDGGALWLEFATDDADLAVEALRWTVDPPQELRPTAVVVCT